MLHGQRRTIKIFFSFKNDPTPKNLELKYILYIYYYAGERGHLH